MTTARSYYRKLRWQLWFIKALWKDVRLDNVGDFARTMRPQRNKVSTMLAKMNLDKDFNWNWRRLRLRMQVNAEITPKIAYVDGDQRYWTTSEGGILFDLTAADGKAIEKPFAQKHNIRTRKKP